MPEEEAAEPAEPLTESPRLWASVDVSCALSTGGATGGFDSALEDTGGGIDAVADGGAGGDADAARPDGLGADPSAEAGAPFGCVADGPFGSDPDAAVCGFSEFPFGLSYFERSNRGGSNRASDFWRIAST